MQGRFWEIFKGRQILHSFLKIKRDLSSNRQIAVVEEQKLTNMYNFELFENKKITLVLTGVKS